MEASTVPALDAVASEVGEWFGGYFDAFRSLAAGERTDLASILGFYGVPLVVVSDARYVALPDRGAVMGFATTTIAQLLQAGYAGGAIHHLDIRPLNARAALIEGTFSRLDRRGAELERVGTAYLAAKTDDGWRFTSLILAAT
jgi:hypothetical protein